MGSLEKVVLDREVDGDIAASREVNMMLDWTCDQATESCCIRHAIGRNSG